MTDDLRKRPTSLYQVSCRVIEGHQGFDPALHEVLDTFYANPAMREEVIRDQPRPVSTLVDAYLAATAEHLASMFRLPCPVWTEFHRLGLKKPYFSGGLESLKAALSVESPVAFRRRLLFVSKNALSRPRLVEPDMDDAFDPAVGVARGIPR